jgi:hypothetical protein
MESAGADFEVEWLQDHATLARPIVLQGEDQALKGAYVIAFVRHGRP